MGWLVADMGGTNTRCAVATPAGVLAHTRQFVNREHAGPEALLRGYLDGLPAADRPRAGVLAIAAPLEGDTVRMINIDWSFSLGGLGQALGLVPLRALNDFEALAYALPVLGPADLHQIGSGTARPGAPKVVLGPGTGLGTAGLVPVAGDWLAVTGEGGHISLAAADDEEAALIAAGRRRYGHCSAERLLSGAGLRFLHEQLHGEILAPDAMGGRLVAGDPAGQRTLGVFFRLLATVASDLALIFAAFGGVYIGGGITPRYLDHLGPAGFRERFEAKGRYQSYLQAIPTWVITASQPTLQGLAAYAASRLRGP